MLNTSLERTPSNLKVFTVCLLLFAFVMTPIASLATPRTFGAGVKEVPATKEADKSTDIKTAASEVFVNPLAPRAEPAPAPPVGAVTATMTATLANDDGDSKLDPTDGNPGTTEKINYSVLLSNTSGAGATGLSFNVPLDSHTSFVAGSLNSTPVAFDQSVNTNEDNAVQITIQGQDPDGSALTFTNISSPTNGSLGAWSSVTCDAAEVCSQTATYTPNADYFGLDSFTFKVNDGTAASNQTGIVSITVTGVNDAPTFTLPAGNPSAVNEDSGAQSVSSFITGVRPAQPGNSTEDSQTVSFAITNVTHSALFTAGGQPALNVSNSGNQPFPLTATLTYTPAPNANGTSVVTYHLHDNGGTANSGVDNSADQTFTITVNAVNDAPVAVDKAYTVQSNMKITGLSLPLTIAGGVSDPDVTNSTSDPNSQDRTYFNANSPTFTLTGGTIAPGSVGGSTACGATGTVSNIVTASGTVTFDYDPPPGFTGACTLVYAITDNGNPGNATSANAKITLTINGPVIWFVDPNRTNNGNGTLSNAPDANGNPGPFKNLSSANAKLATLGTNQKVFIYTGTLNAANAAGEGIDLAANNDWLVGQGTVASSFDAFFGLTGGNAPPAGTVTRPTLNSNTTTANSARPTVHGTVTMRDLTQVTGLNIDVSGVAGATKGLTSAGFTNVSKVSLISDVSVTSASGNAVDLSGAQTITYVTSDNANSPNTITSTTGTALSVVTSTIGANGFNFKSINAGTAASGPTNGIVLNTTGTAAGNGGLTVTGTGTTAGSGGTIQKATNSGIKITSAKSITLSNMNLTNNASTNGTTNVACGNNLVAGDTTGCSANLYLSTVPSGVSLTNLTISGSNQEGIAGTAVVGFTLANSTINNNGNEDYEDGFLFKNLTGTVSITNTIVRDNFSRQSHIYNDAGTMTLTVSGSRFGRNTAPGVSSQQGMLLELAGNSVNTVDMGTSTIDNNGNGNGLAISVTGTATLGSSGAHSSMHNMTSLTNNAAHIFMATSGSGTAYFDTLNNSVMTAAGLQSIDYFAPGGTLHGAISNNVIGTNNVAASGCATALGGCDGMTLDQAGNGAGSGTMVLSITGNTIQQVNTNGIEMSSDFSNALQATITGNTIRQPSNSAAVNSQGNAFFLNIGVSSNSTANTACITFTGNTIQDTASKTWDINGSAAAVFAETRHNAITRFPGAAGSGTVNAKAYIEGNNTFNIVFGGEAKSLVTTATGGTFVNGAACSSPLLLATGGVSPVVADSTPSRIDFSKILTGVNVEVFDFNRSSMATNDAGESRAPAAMPPFVTDRLTQSQLDSIVGSAIARWAASGLSAPQLAALRAIRFEVADLDGSYLGSAESNRILVDGSAGGRGWFVDATDSNLSFAHRVSKTRLYSDAAAAPAGHVDLLTAIEHEMGHKLGLDDTYARSDRDDLMYGYLTVGERRLPALGQAQNVSGSAAATTHHLMLATDGRRSSDPLFANISGAITGVRSVAGYLNPFMPMFSGGTFPINGLNNNGFTLPTGKTITITFSVTLNNPPNLSGVPPATPTVSNQGTLSGSFTGNPLLTDDPSVGGTTDPTVTNVDLFNTTSSLSSAPSNSTNTGQAVTFTATIAFTNSGSPAPASGSPSGTVNFKDGASSIPGCSAISVSPVSTGTASAQCVTSSLSTATHNNITAVYSGDGSYDTSTSAPFTQTVTQSGTTVTVTSSLNPSLVTQNVTFTATVASTGGFAGPPTGTLTFKDGGSTIPCSNGGGAQTLSSGSATCQIATLIAGNHSITAVYGGDTNFTGNTGTLSMSGGQNGDPQVVNKSNTTLTLGTSGSPVTPGTNVTFTATINSATAVTANRTGTVTFYDGSATPGNEITACGAAGVVTVSSNQAQCSTTTLSEATHTITAVYSGDATYSGNANTVQQVVAKNATNTALVSSQNPSAPTDPVTFTATVTSGAGTPTGNVAFKDNNLDISGCGTVALDGSGQAQCLVPGGTFSAATHPITAVYAGTATFATSTSNTVNQNVIACTNAITVMNTSDSGAGSLRQAIIDVCDSGTITFSNTTAGGATNFSDGNVHTINLADTAYNELLVNKSVTITGPGASVLTVQRVNGATNPFRVFDISSGKTVTISGMTISNGLSNSAALTNAGGGILNDHGTLTLTGVVVSANTAEIAGGIYNKGDTSGTASLTITNSTISGNTVTFADGGGIYNDGTNGGTATLIVTNTTINDNHANGTGLSGHGGGIVNQGLSGTASATLTNSTISGNTSTVSGGGVFNENGTVTLTSCTVTGNTADSDNNASGTGGGVRAQTATVTLKNTIVAGNYRGTTATASDIEGVSVDAASSYNLIGDAATSGGLTNGVDFNIVGNGGSGTITTSSILNTTLASNGGSTQTHALVFNSPALEKGNAFSLTTDQRGFARPVDYDNVAPVAPYDDTDIGAYELQVQPGAPNAPDLDAASDTGISSTDNLTSDTSPTFTITGVTPGATVELLRDVSPGTGTAQQETATVVVPTTISGNCSVAVTVTAAGMNNSPKTINVAVASGDNAAGVATKIRTALTADPDINAFFTVATGTNPEDILLTARTAATDDGTMNIALAKGTCLVADFTDAPTSADTAAGAAGPVVRASGVAVGTSIQLTDPSVAGSATPYLYTARQTVSGAPRSAQSSSLSVTIDTSTPAAPDAPNLDDASDTGISNSDNLTNDTTPTFTIGNVSNGNTVYLLRDTVPTTGVVQVASGVASGSSIQLTDPSAPQGVYVYTSRQSNGVNTTDSATGLTVTIDTTPPAAPGTPDLQAGSDTFGAGGTGTNSDNITSAGSRAFDIASTTNGVRVELYRGATFIGFTTGNGGTVTITDSTSPGDNTYSYTARQVDDAGNFASSVGLNVTIDTTATAAGIPDLQPGSDSGPSNSDNYTNAASRSFDIPNTENGSLVELYRGVTFIASTTGNGGTVTLTDNSSPGDGSYDYTSKQTDLAGNSASSNILTVTIDTTPNAPGTPDLQSASDAGASSTDNRTDNATHSFDIASQSGDLVELLRNGNPVSSTTAAGASVTLSDSASLADGVYHYTARQTDLAGNVATSAGTLDVTIDTTAPTVVSDTCASANPTSAASVDFTVTFSEDVTGVDTTDFTAVGTGGVTGVSVTTVTPVNAKVYTVTVNTGSGDGGLRLDVLNDGSIKDVMNIALGAGFNAGQVYTVDRSNPFVTSITRAGSTPTNTATVDFTVTFSEPVSGVDITDFALITSGLGGVPAVTNVSPNSGPATTYTVTASTGSGNGTIKLKLNDNNSITDAVGKTLAASPGTTENDGSFTPTDGAAKYDIDRTAPVATIDQAVGQTDPVSGPTASTVINFKVTLSESLTTASAIASFTNSDISLSGTAGATVANITGSGDTYNVAVEGMTQSGTVIINIDAGAFQDDAGNLNGASTIVDNTVTFNVDNFTTFEVNSTADTDDGQCAPIGTGNGCTLREAINAANTDAGAETITFNSTVFASPGPYTISLLTALPNITTDMTIQGPGAKVLTVERNSGAATRFRIFTITSGTVSISGVTITKGLTADGTNGVNGTDGTAGGGISNSGSLTLTAVAVSGNQAGKGGTGSSQGGFGGAGGGILNNSGGSLTITDSTISGNHAGNGGNSSGGGTNGGGGAAGGMLLLSGSGTIIITNSTISGNQSGNPGTGGAVAGLIGSAGGIGVQGGTVTISNSTITANNTGANGGGIVKVGGTITLKSTIVGANTAGSSPDISGSVNSEGYNLIQSTSGATINETLNPGTNVTGQDPGLDPLADNGGPTMTHSLLCTSPAIDKGKAFGLTTDQRGGTRPFDFADAIFPNAAGGDGTDIGAFETQSGGGCVPTAVSPNPQPTTNEDNPVTVQLKAVYSQNVQMTFSIDTPPANGTLGSIMNTSCSFNLSTTCTATVQYTPNADYFGADTFKFKASTNPGGLTSDPADVNVTINSVNDPPSFLLGPNQNILEDAGPQTVANFANTISIGPANETGQTYQFILQTNTNPGLFSAAPALDTAGTLTYTTAANKNGLATITFVMKDSGGTLNGGNDTSVPRTFTINVTSVNDPPTFTKGPDIVVDENAPQQTINNWATNILAGPPDESGQTVNFKVIDFTNPSLFSIGPLINSNGQLTFTPAPNQSGTSTATIVLKDNGGTANGGVDTSAEQTFTITIREGGSLQFSSATYSVGEGGGSAVITITRTGGTAGATSVQFATSNGTATAGSDYTAVSQTVTFNDGDTSKTVNIPITNDLINEPNETVNLTLSGITGSGELGAPSAAVLTIADDDPVGGYIKFSSANYSVAEGGIATITVQRVGTLTQSVTVNYATSDSSVGPQTSCAPTPGNTLASSRCDFTSAFGQITFGAGDGADKTFTVLIDQDSYVEGPETLSLTLSNPTGGANLVTPSTSTLTINDDVSEPASNLVDDTSTFVEQLYRDFLNRPSDAPGKAFWVDNIDRCNDPARRLPGLTQAQCIEVQRINTAAAFFLSIEFQTTGGTAYLTNKAAFGTVPTFLNFESDAQAIGKGYVFGQAGAEAILEANKVAYFDAFVARSSFTAIYGGLTNTQYVDTLIANTGVSFTPAERNALINGLNAATETRATVLRKVAEKASFRDAEFNRIFVLMEYFGFLRRDPDAAGFNFWLTKLNQFNGNYIAAEMIKAFISSAEYRGRFGP